MEFVSHGKASPTDQDCLPLIKKDLDWACNVGFGYCLHRKIILVSLKGV